MHKKIDIQNLFKLVTELGYGYLILPRWHDEATISKLLIETERKATRQANYTLVIYLRTEISVDHPGTQPAQTESKLDKKGVLFRNIET